MKAYKAIKNKKNYENTYSAAVALTAGWFGGKELPPDQTAVASMGRGPRMSSGGNSLPQNQPAAG